MQKRHWGGGNKNEAIICIGIDDHNNIQWAGVFSWSKNETFKIEIRDYIEKHKRLDKNTFLYIIDYSYKDLEKNFVRREFAEFSYLTVEPPGWALWTTFILVFVFCVGLTIWNLTNEHDIDGINYR